MVRNHATDIATCLHRSFGRRDTGASDLFCASVNSNFHIRSNYFTKSLYNSSSPISEKTSFQEFIVTLYLPGT